MSGRRIYVDIDDVLSHTVESLIDLLERLHARRVEVSDCLHFDLGRSFSLDAAALDHFMHHANADEVIESIAPTSGAASVLGAWRSAGDHVSLMTGRPPKTREASIRWLETHALTHDELHHLDKWNRPSWNDEALPALRFEEIREFQFEFAVEDSLETAIRLVEEFEIPVALMDRPWNRATDSLPESTRAGLVRCRDWDDVAHRFGHAVPADRSATHPRGRTDEGGER